MSCPKGVMEQFSTYAICSPNLWMIIACTFMTLLTMLMLVYLNHSFKKDVEWLRFFHWKLQQLAERLRFQEPNVTLLEGITRKMNERIHDHTFDDFFQKSREDGDKMKKMSKENGEGGDVAAKVKRAKEADAEKVFRETNIDSKTPLLGHKSDPDSASILKKWTDATKDILAIDDEDPKTPSKKDKNGGKKDGK